MVQARPRRLRRAGQLRRQHRALGDELRRRQRLPLRRPSPVASGYWPDKFLHLADVVPYDATAPTAPGRPRVVAHQGRVGLVVAALRRRRPAWRATGCSATACQMRHPAEPSYWDRQVSAGSGLRLRRGGRRRRPATPRRPVRARVVPGAEAADRAWVTTGAGPALCGRSRDRRAPQLTCTVLTDAGWRRVAAARGRTDWGHVGQPALRDHATATWPTAAPSGRPRRSAAATCTTLDADDADLGPRRPVRAAAAARGRPDLAPDRRRARRSADSAAAPPRQRLGCACSPTSGWRCRGLHRTTRWGAPHQSRVRRRRRPGVVLPDGRPRPQPPSGCPARPSTPAPDVGLRPHVRPARHGRPGRGHLAAHGCRARRCAAAPARPPGLPRARLVGLAVRPGPPGRRQRPSTSRSSRRERRRLLVPHRCAPEAAYRAACAPLDSKRHRWGATSAPSARTALATESTAPGWPPPPARRSAAAPAPRTASASAATCSPTTGGLVRLRHGVVGQPRLPRLRRQR